MYSVSLFIPCIVDHWLPRIGTATVELLRSLGCRPFYRREQTCCGQVLANSGHLEGAKKLARRMIEIFEEDELIVCPSASCVHMVRSQYPLLFQEEPEWQNRAKELAGRVYELSEFLVDYMRVMDVGARFSGSAAYHASCSHLRGLGLSTQPKSLMESVEGLQPVAMQNEQECCGFGGRFAVQYPDISTAMVADKAAHFLDSGADVLLLCEPGCLLNISGYLSRHHPEKSANHLAVFLADHLEQ